MSNSDSTSSEQPRNIGSPLFDASRLGLMLRHRPVFIRPQRAEVITMTSLFQRQRALIVSSWQNSCTLFSSVTTFVLQSVLLNKMLLGSRLWRENTIGNVCQKSICPARVLTYERIDLETSFMVAYAGIQLQNVNFVNQGHRGTVKVTRAKSMSVCREWVSVGFNVPLDTL